MQLGTTLDFTPYLAQAVEGTLYVAVLIFILFSLILGYHVTQYSLFRTRAMGLFAGYLIGGALIIVSMTTAFFAL
jgi:LytS/YehU family sensor histidine kinase